MKRTNRGFAIYAEIMDDKGQLVRVQKSSIADRRCVWIFSEGKDGQDGVFHMGSWQAYSPHLTAKQARRVAKALNDFADGKD